MSKPAPVPDSAPSFLLQLLAMRDTPAHRLSDLEVRLLEITKALWFDGTTLARIEGAGDELLPISPAVAARGAALAFAAAVEVEQPLRDIRSRIGGGR